MFHLWFEASDTFGLLAMWVMCDVSDIEHMVAAIGANGKHLMPFRGLSYAGSPKLFCTEWRQSWSEWWLVAIVWPLFHYLIIFNKLLNQTFTRTECRVTHQWSHLRLTNVCFTVEPQWGLQWLRWPDSQFSHNKSVLDLTWNELCIYLFKVKKGFLEEIWLWRLEML